MKEILNTNEPAKDEQNWISKKEFMDICKCSAKVLEHIVADLSCRRPADTQSHIKKGGYHNREVFYDDYLVRLIQAKMLSNQANQGRSSQVVKQAVHNIVENNGYKYTKEEICSICNCSISSFEHFAPQELTERDFIVVGSNHKKLYTESVLQQFQLWLMKNQANQGRSSQVVKQATKDNIELGALAHVALTNREAWEQFKALGDAKLEAEERLKLEQQQNQKLQLENYKLNEENDYLKKLNDFNTTQLGYYTKKYHSWYDDYENY